MLSATKAVEKTAILSYYSLLASSREPIAGFDLFAWRYTSTIRKNRGVAREELSDYRSSRKLELRSVLRSEGPAQGIEWTRKNGLAVKLFIS